MTKVTYICGATGKRVEGTTESMPEGWIVPPTRIPRDNKPLPRHTVVAVSGEKAWKRLLEAAMNDATLWADTLRKHGP
jgi:hypothetical protein